MYFTNYVKQDGYYESLASLKEGLGPILKCRVVLCSEVNGGYEQVVRDYTTGKMVASKRHGDSLRTAKDATQRLAISFIESEMNIYHYEDSFSGDKS